MMLASERLIIYATRTENNANKFIVVIESIYHTTSADTGSGLPESDATFTTTASWFV